MKIGKTVSEMINNDNKTELKVVSEYNDGILLACQVGDQGTFDLLTKILKEEEGHADWAEIQPAQIEQMGMENYLVNQTDSSKAVKTKASKAHLHFRADRRSFQLQYRAFKLFGKSGKIKDQQMKFFNTIK